MIEDLSRGHVPNIFAERGWNAEWKYNRKNFVIKVAAGAAVTAAVIMLLARNSKRKNDAKTL